MLSLFSALCLLLFLAGDASALALKRHALSNEIRMTALLTGIDSGVYQIDDKVIRAMARVPRHHYINQPFRKLAYHNIALPAPGQNYTIPEPFLTAMFIHLMNLKPGDKVLDIGFEAGYDAAVMADLAGEVHTLRLGPPVFAAAMRPVASYPRAAFTVHEAGSTLGLKDAAPYDAIAVRQSMPAPPRVLLDQLKPGGKLVMPVGAPGDLQRLTVFTRTENGEIRERKTLYVKFAPLFEGREI